MGIITKSIQKMKEDGVSSFISNSPHYAKAQSYSLQRVLSTYANTKITIGENVFEKDWDVLILLDTCRIDALRAVANEYEWIREVDSIRSVGGASPEWISKTFVRNYQQIVNNTAYITTNTYSKWILDKSTQRPGGYKNKQQQLLSTLPIMNGEEFGKCKYLNELEGRGMEGPKGHTEGHTPPRYLTDRGVEISRKEEYERMILHYWQPHYPYVASALEENRKLHPYERMVSDWRQYIRKTGDKEMIWKRYMNELRYVLDDLEILVNNLEADTVIISSDHGEAFGEYGVYGHHSGSLHPQVRNVPWASIETKDSGEYTPNTKIPNSSQSNQSVKSQLEALGYM